MLDSENSAVNLDELRRALRAYIDRTKYSQERVAELVGVSQPLISRLLAGRVARVHDATASKLHSFLDDSEPAHVLTPYRSGSTSDPSWSSIQDKDTFDKRSDCNELRKHDFVERMPSGKLFVDELGSAILRARAKSGPDTD